MKSRNFPSLMAAGALGVSVAGQAFGGGEGVPPGPSTKEFDLPSIDNRPALLPRPVRRGEGWGEGAFGSSPVGHSNSLAVPPGPPPGKAIMVPLEYREMRAPFLFRHVPLRRCPSPFPKEPELGSDRVVRGVMQFGNQSANAISFLWQPGAQKLYLDLNRNQDLTDDSAGVIAGRLTGPRLPEVYHQLFTNIHLSFPASSAGAPIQVDLNVFQHRKTGPLLVNVQGRSYWQGKMTVDGRDWEVGLLPNLSDRPGSFEHGQVLLRPWKDHGQGFYAWSSSEDSYATPFEYRNRVLKAPEAFEFSRQVFFADHAWRLDWGEEPAGSRASFAVRFAEQQPVLGEVTITGRFIDRLVLSGDPYTVLLTQPSERVRLPVGRYNQPRIQLRQGLVTAYFDSLPKSGKRTVPEPRTGGVRPISGAREAGKVLVVEEGQPAVLVAGGPLTNSLSVTRHEQQLHITYRLLGAGGAEYKLWEWWRTKRDSPPRFVVFQGDKQVGSGKFDFG